VSVQVGSGRNTARYNLPAALFCYHSHLFRQEISHQKAVRAQLRANKKRKLSSDGETSTRIKAEDSESEMRTYSSDGGQCTEDDAVLKLLGVDPFIFGLFLKLVYTGYYPAAVDARPEATRPMAQVNKTLQPDTPYTPARASMPPPANINSQQGLPGGPLPYLPVLSSKISTISLEDSSHQVQIPPSVHAYMLSVQLGAPAFLNRAINHIYYGIGKHFILGPSLVHYIWSDTLPHPLCSPSPLRKLILDVMAVHWSSTTTHITAKQPVLHRLWNELLDLHRDLRHGFTMGLQGVRKVLPVQSYFMDTCNSKLRLGESSRSSMFRLSTLRLKTTTRPSLLRLRLLQRNLRSARTRRRSDRCSYLRTLNSVMKVR
jgi:hypothetical protein